jgi:hypothetical protein
MVFGFMAAPSRGSEEAILLAASIRAFAGRLADSPILAMVPGSPDALSEATTSALRDLGVDIRDFTIDQPALGFPFAAKVYAAAAAEVVAAERGGLLVWMDRGSLVVQEPAALLLPPGKALAYRPVDHTLIGSPYDEPLDTFWSLVYQFCGVPAQHVFPMTTSVDRRVLRPYFNAGLLVVRPGQGLLRRWRDNFHQLYLRPELTALYQQSELYAIFVHQAILAATVLATLAPPELVELPVQVNYPLHMHAGYPAGQRPARLNDLISFRYESLLQNGTWRDTIPVDEPLHSWLEQHLTEGTSPRNTANMI